MCIPRPPGGGSWMVNVQYGHLAPITVTGHPWAAFDAAKPTLTSAQSWKHGINVPGW